MGDPEVLKSTSPFWRDTEKVKGFSVYVNFRSDSDEPVPLGLGKTLSGTWYTV